MHKSIDSNDIVRRISILDTVLNELEARIGCILVKVSKLEAFTSEVNVGDNRKAPGHHDLDEGALILSPTSLSFESSQHQLTFIELAGSLGNAATQVAGESNLNDFEVSNSLLLNDYGVVLSHKEAHDCPSSGGQFN